jgi:ribosome-binding protein aMBF1 (putative translation factor)
MARKRTRNFGDVIRAKLAANPGLAKAVEEESFNADIARQVYDLRMEACLTQKQLAEMVGTKQSVISRIEDADYRGHSLMMLKRIASALKRRLKVDFCNSN